MQKPSEMKEQYYSFGRRQYLAQVLLKPAPKTPRLRTIPQKAASSSKLAKYLDKQIGDRKKAEKKTNRIRLGSFALRMRVLKSLMGFFR